MELLAEIKEKLGVSQQEIADYLGISRSAISMAEGDRRELPTKAMLKLLKLQQLLGETRKFSHTAPKNKNSASKKFLLAHYEDCLQKQQQLRKKLNAVLAANAAAEKVLKITALLLNNLPTGAEGKKDKVWLELLITRNQEILEQNNPVTISLLQLQIKTAKYEAKQVLLLAKK